MGLRPGLSATIRLEVTDTDTAEAMGSGEVPVLATPRVLALVEEATVAAVSGEVALDSTTVGCSVQLDHLAPTLVGAAVEAEAVLVKVEGRRLIFKVTAHDDRGLVAAGKITRAVVERSRFLEKAGEPGD